jgi:hypothetical protein
VVILPNEISSHKARLEGYSNPASVVNDNLGTRASCLLQCERDARAPSKSTNQVGLLYLRKKSNIHLPFHRALMPSATNA